MAEQHLRKAGEKAIRRHVKDGWTQEQIAEHYDVTQGAVQKYMARHGIAPANPHTGRPRNDQAKCTCHQPSEHLPNCRIYR